MFSDDEAFCWFSGCCPFQFPKNFSPGQQVLIEKFAEKFSVPYHEVLSFLSGVERKFVK